MPLNAADEKFMLGHVKYIEIYPNSWYNIISEGIDYGKEET
jgi:hypothetical protein